MKVEVEFADSIRDVEVAVEVADGETLALLGPNGSGKSTLLAVVAGLVRPDSGRVVLDGEALTDVGPGRPGTMVAPHARRCLLYTSPSPRD